ncbi:MAG: TlpA disulfide reductase family protein [bacterium]|nr:TlpA disulfide reductase family protein [bacterium]
MFRALGLACLLAVGLGAPAWSYPKIAPDFTLPRSGDARPVSLSDFKGKVRLVNFWATWCPPCRAEIPAFIELRHQLAGRPFEIIGIALDREGDEAVSPFIREHGMDYPVVIGDSGVTRAYGGIRGIPTTFLLDRQGKVVHRWVGPPGGEEAAIIPTLMQHIKPLL